ncbi:MAG: hypothetical protein V7K35_13395 [Nostoc sp.]|uniref:hypothetical protein n=1 Tax=Nostoc sp. TaxID=1180 RepID=UPI002FFA17E2
MKTKNGQTQDVSGRRKTSQYKNESTGLGKHGQDSPGEGNNQIGNAPTDSTGEDTSRSNRERNPNPGKILERLELIERTFLSYVRGHQHRLETRLDESKSVETTFKEEVQALKQEIYHLTSDTNEENQE